MYVGKIEPVTKFKANERKYQKAHISNSESKTTNNSQKQANHPQTPITPLASQTLFDVALLHSDS